MAPQPHNAAQRAAYWPVPIARAIPAAALGLVITFSADHSARFGLIVFGAFGIVSGLVIAATAALRLAGSGARSFFIAQGAVTVAAGVLALVATGGGVQYLFLIVTVFAAITGFLELYSGLRTRGRFVASGDWVATGVLTAVAAIVFVLIPPGFRQTFTGPDGVPRVLDSAVVAVGLLGAYGAIIAVYLLIAGLSAKWGTQAVSAAEPVQPSEAERETSA
ncbi:MAG TPA: hypothetical protein DCP11_13280 [Microbacteriaceae bacterium]|nr:hypothetical protein [Microbacteriaceae bacterium]